MSRLQTLVAKRQQAEARWRKAMRQAEIAEERSIALKAKTKAALLEIECESTWDTDWTRDRLEQALNSINVCARKALGKDAP